MRPARGVPEREVTAMASTVWKGHLTFGLVSFPIKLYSAARSESISFNQLHKADNSRVKQVLFCQAEDKPIPRSEIVKGFEYEKDRYVVIEDEEVKKVAPQTAKVMEILEFVKSEQVDPIYYETSYYLAPDEAGEKPYALGLEALRKTVDLTWVSQKDRDAQSRAHRPVAARQKWRAAAYDVLQPRNP